MVCTDARTNATNDISRVRLFGCSILQHTTIHCNTLLQHSTATHPGTRGQEKDDQSGHAQHTATHCSTLQHNTTSRTAHCNTLQHTATHYNTLQHTATHCCNTPGNARSGGRRSERSRAKLSSGVTIGT